MFLLIVYISGMLGVYVYRFLNKINMKSELIFIRKCLLEVLLIRGD